MTEYKISPATEADVPDIHRLITDLAIYEKEPDAVEATHESLRETIFEHKYANVVLARTPEGEAVGMALGEDLTGQYFFNYSTWQGAPGLYLEDLFVSESHRGNGLGKKLFGELGKIAQEKKCGRVEWKVLKWNQPSIDFYVHCLKSVPQSEWEWMRVEGKEGIARLADMHQ